MNIKYLYILIISFYLSGCEEIIHVDLNEADPRYVIVGDINDLSDRQVIKVSQTVAFDELIKNKPIDNASVVITDSNGGRFLFNSIGNGEYRARFKPKAKTTYYLKVNINEESFESSSYMNEYVEVDSLGVIEDIIFSDTVYSLTLKFVDPNNGPNYYKYNLSVNGGDFVFSNIFSDKFNNGLFVTHQISDLNNKITLGDTVVVRRQVVDKPVFTYWNDVQMTNPGSAAPANPRSNISNGALGYFSVNSAKLYGFRVRFLNTEIED